MISAESNSPKSGIVISNTKRNWVFGMVGAVLLLAGSIYGVDWLNYFTGTANLYPIIAKPVITLLAMGIVLSASRNNLSTKDWRLLCAAFCCMLPTDILMSVVVLSPALGVGSWVFMVGGVLSILAHIFLILRMARGLPYLRHYKWSDAWLPLVIYGVAAVILGILWKDVVRVGMPSSGRSTPPSSARRCGSPGKPSNAGFTRGQMCGWLRLQPPAGLPPRSPGRSTTLDWGISRRSCSGWCGSFMGRMWCCGR